MNKKKQAERTEIFDVVSLGELLIDFTPCGRSEQDHDMLEVNPGGGPCNVLSMVSQLGGKTAFIGKVGEDHFGHQLAEQVKQRNINTDGVIFDKNYFTTLAFVHLDSTGDRSFSFARKPGADIMLNKKEVPLHILENCKVFHYSTLSMTDQPVRKTIQWTLDRLAQTSTIISFDPNIRPFLWKSMEDAKREMNFGLQYCQVLKISEEELYLATGTEDFEKGVAWIMNRFPNIKLIFATLGKAGCYYRLEKIVGRQKAFDVKTIDTTGAGDTFVGCCLWKIAQKGNLDFEAKELEELMIFANSAASIITTRRGALNVVPTIEEIEELIRQGKLLE